MRTRAKPFDSNQDAGFAQYTSLGVFDGVGICICFVSFASSSCFFLLFLFFAHS